MPYKIKHYARPVSTNVHTLWEAALIELCVGLISAGMAFWARDIVVQLFVGCLIVAALCFLLTFHNIYIIIKLQLKNRKANMPRKSQE
ncbi:hypothetical protein [Glaciecola sp. SC05]|uniref:hypothetical protein n=1 Tax=Glaciecola sp. SC05 TaxID=1987355 RepID=UPI0035272E54